ISQRSVLFLPEFKQAWNYSSGGVSNGKPSKDWLFIDATTVSTNPAYKISTTYPLNNLVGYSKSKVPVVPFCLAVPITNLATCPNISSETFRGILLGDVNGNYGNVASNGL